MLGLNFLTMIRAQYCPENFASILDHFHALGWTCTHIPTGGDATFEREMYKSIVVGKMVHMVIYLGLPIGELDAVVEVLQQQRYIKVCAEKWKRSSELGVSV